MSGSSLRRDDRRLKLSSGRYRSAVDLAKRLAIRVRVFASEYSRREIGDAMATHGWHWTVVAIRLCVSRLPKLAELPREEFAGQIPRDR